MLLVADLGAGLFEAEGALADLGNIALDGHAGAHVLGIELRAQHDA